MTKVWTFKGQRAEVPAAGANKKRCVYGALNFKTGQVHYLVHPNKNATQFNEFLRQLLEANRKRFLVLVLDNATYHKTRQNLDLLAEHEGHTLVVWLPKYSPELNDIEGLWGYLKKTALNNHFYGDIECLENAIDTTFKVLNQNPETTLTLLYRTSQNLCRTA